VSDELERFIKAQNNTFAGFADALREIQTDCKCGHWIWYVFPQLSGLGSSWSAQFYGIDGVDEARAYLTHPVLRERLASITTAVAARLTAGARLRALMSSHVDALKVVSSLTLFQEVASRMSVTGDQPELRAFADSANDVLVRAAEQGYSRCAYTAAALNGSAG
jgi:uncharacterized protein (DUF1810 family)